MEFTVSNSNMEKTIYNRLCIGITGWSTFAVDFNKLLAAYKIIHLS